MVGSSPHYNSSTTRIRGRWRQLNIPCLPRIAFDAHLNAFPSTLTAANTILRSLRNVVEAHRSAKPF